MLKKDKLAFLSSHDNLNNIFKKASNITYNTCNEIYNGIN